MRPLQSLIFALAIAVPIPHANAQSPASEPSATTATQLDLGNDSNIELKTQESAQPSRQSLLPIDRDLRNQTQSWKRRLKDGLGLDIALDSTTIYQLTSGVRSANHAIENTTSLSGLWTFYKRPDSVDALGIGFAAETRNNFSGSSFPEMTADLGTLWSPNDSTSAAYSKITQLWFGQRLADGRFICLLGKIDPGSYINGNQYAGSGNTQFFSQPFATNPARTFSDNGLGVIARLAPVDWLHIQGLFSDSDAVSNASPFTSIKGNWLYAGELAVKPNIPGLGQGNYRLMLYHRDTLPSPTSGWALSFDQALGEQFGAFFRFGDNDGRAGLVKQIASAGISLLRPFGRKDDQTGIGLAYTLPSSNQNREEYSSEAYYRIQLTDYIELSASAQAVFHPAATNEDLIAIFGLRLRFLF